MLLTRRNEALESVLRQELDNMEVAEGRSPGEKEKQTKRGRPSGPGKAKAKA